MDCHNVQQNGIKSPIFKCTTAIGAAGGANSAMAAEAKQDILLHAAQYPDWFSTLMSIPWGTIASMAAALYTCALMSEWLWKKVFSPILVRIGVKDAEVRLTEAEWQDRYLKGK